MDKKYLTSHTYELRNKGPSPLPTSTLMILYPQIQQGGSALLYLNTTRVKYIMYMKRIHFNLNIQFTFFLFFVFLIKENTE